MRIRQQRFRQRAAVEIWTPAKLNLFLEVLERRPDGYHEIVTLIAAINRFDTLTFVPHDEPAIELDCQWAAGMAAATVLEPLPPATENLAWRALRLLQQRTNCSQGGRATLIKRIPAAAGLGGGSSDAAAALVAGNLAWNLNWSREQLAELAAELGSDVPVFLHLGAGEPAMAVCRGRGEQVTRVSTPAGWHFVVARPATGLATPAVYRQCRPSESPASLEQLLAAIQAGNSAAAARRMVNRLQPAAETLSPDIVKLKEQFESLSALGHQLSGSGTAYFGWFANARSAARAARRLRAAGLPHAWHVQSI